MVGKTKRLIFVSALVFSIMTAGAYGISKAYAQDNSNQASLVQLIATKFNLKTSDVQAVFDQYRQDRQTEMQAKYEQMLTDAVSKGELTEEKKQLILTKHKELLANRPDFSSLSKDQMKTKMQEQRQALESWAQQNGIDIKYLRGGLGKGDHMGFGRKMKQ